MNDEMIMLTRFNVLRWASLFGLLVWLPLGTTSNECNSGEELFRAHDLTIYMYMWYIKGSEEWMEFPCPTGTNWNTEACECIHNTGLVCDLAEPIKKQPSKYRLYQDYNLSYYTIEDCEDLFPGLVYNSELCQCTWPDHIDFPAGTDPQDCHLMLDMSFNELPLKSKTDIHIDQTSGMTIVNDFRAREGIALKLIDAPIRVPLFHNGFLSSCFRFFIRFRVEIRPYNANRFFVVLTNAACTEDDKLNTTTLLYKPDTQEYKLRFSRKLEIHCTYVAGRSTDWKRVNIVYQDKTAYLFVNGKICGSPLQKLPWTIDLPCPLSIAGRAKAREGHTNTDEGHNTDVSFMGFLDEMVVLRGCCVDRDLLKLFD